MSDAVGAVGAHGLSYVQVGSLFLVLVGFNLAIGAVPTSRGERSRPLSAFIGALLSWQRLAAWALIAAAAVVMGWPVEGQIDALSLVVFLVGALLVVGGATAWSLRKASRPVRVRDKSQR